MSRGMNSSSSIPYPGEINSMKKYTFLYDMKSAIIKSEFFYDVAVGIKTSQKDDNVWL